MPKSPDPKPIIDFHALAERMELSPEKAKRLGETFFSSLTDRRASLSTALIEASRSAKVKPRQLTQLLSVMAEDFGRPVPKAGTSLSERLSGAAGDAREKASETVERIGKGIASVDIGALRREGADKVAELRERAANVDTTDLTDQAKELGDKAIEGARDLAGKFGKSIAAAIPKAATTPAEK